MARPSADVLDPQSHSRRSPIWRELAAAGARFGTVGDSMVAAAFGEGLEGELRSIRKLGVADLSPLARTGVKGRAAPGWLVGQGVEVGEESNRAYRCGRHSLAVRLAPGEVLILGGRDGTDELPQTLEQAWTVKAGMVFPVPRRDGMFWFLILGEHAAAMLAKLCAVDLRPDKFGDLSVAQTSVARISAIVVRDDLGDVVCYHLLGDSAAASSMWSYLTDAMTEHGGKAVGIDAISRVAIQSAARSGADPANPRA